MNINREIQKCTDSPNVGHAKEETWEATSILLLFLGIFIGVLVGGIPIFFPGLPAPAKLGLAGGPLLVAILLGHKGRIGKVSFHMSPQVIFLCVIWVFFSSSLA